KMLKSIRQRMEDREEGFTLIELMVVVLIIAILIAIAIPTFLGARQRAQDRAAQSNLRNAFTAEKVYYTDNNSYADGATMAASNIETSLTFQAGAAAAGTRQVQVAISAGGVSVCLTGVSASGTTFGLKDVSSGAAAGTYYTRAAWAGACDDT